MSAILTGRAYAWLALVLAAFVIYISLIPFDLRLMPLEPALAQFWTTLSGPWPRRVSRTNFLANVLLFVPIGFALMGMILVERRRHWRAAVSSPVLVLLISAALSVTAEFLQVFAPRRVPSTLDIVAQLIGASLGILAWAFAGRPLTAWVHAAAAAVKEDRLSRLLTGYAAAWVFVNLAPFDITIDPGDLIRRWRSGRIVLEPFGSGIGATRLVWDTLAATISAIPLGVFGLVRAHDRATQRDARAAFLAGAAFIVTIEIAQMFIESHAADVTDVLFGLLGLAVGILLGRGVLARGRQPRESGHTRTSVVGLSALAGWCVVLAIYHWQPYDFAVDSQVIREKLRRLSLLPFTGYTGSDLNAFKDVLLKLALSIPFGFIASRFVPRAAHPAFARTGWLLLAGVVFAGLELGQFFLPSRVPDPTDVLLGMLGAYIGLAVGEWLSSPSQR